MSGVWHLITKSMLQRSVWASFLVGGVLFLINHDAAAILGPWNGATWKQLGLSMVVPFVVSLTSAMLTRRELLRAAEPSRGAFTPDEALKGQ